MSIMIAGNALERYQLVMKAQERLRSALGLEPTPRSIEAVDEALAETDRILDSGSCRVEELIDAGYGPVLEDALRVFLLTVEQDAQEALEMLQKLRTRRVDA